MSNRMMTDSTNYECEDCGRHVTRDEHYVANPINRAMSNPEWPGIEVIEYGHSDGCRTACR